MPAKVPVAALKVMPAGSVPVNVVVYGAMPPLTVNACAYAVPAMAPGSVAGVRVRVGTATTTVYAWAPLWPNASVAVTVKLNVPDTVGVPDSAPAADSAVPVGRLPAVTAKA